MSESKYRASTRAHGGTSLPGEMPRRVSGLVRVGGILVLGAFFTVWLVAAVWLKVSAAEAGAYTSDIYDFHSSLRNTVSGELFRSYFWGNVMGDHGYLILWLLIPAYWMAPSASFWILVVVTPVAYAGCAAAITAILAYRRYPWWGAVSIAFLAVPGLFWLAHEPLYGFHPDTLAGPLLALAAVGMGLRKGRSRDFGDWLGLAGFVLFVLLKEEMAILGLLFAAPFVARNASRRIGVVLISIAGVAAFASFAIIAAFVTPLNRTNTLLVNTLVDQLLLRNESGIAEMFRAVIPLAIGVGILDITTLFRQRMATVDIGVALVVAAKVAFLAVVLGGLPETSWHLSIPMFAFWYVLFRLAPQLFRAPTRRAAAVVVSFAAVLLAVGVVFVDVGWYSSYTERLDRRRSESELAVVAAEALVGEVGDRVVSVSTFDIHAWRDTRVSTFDSNAWRDARVTVPLAALMRFPRGISDALVVTSGDLDKRYDEFLSCFVLRRTYGGRELYVRVSDCSMENDRASLYESAR